MPRAVRLLQQLLREPLLSPEHGTVTPLLADCRPPASSSEHETILPSYSMCVSQSSSYLSLFGVCWGEFSFVHTHAGRRESPASITLHQTSYWPCWPCAHHPDAQTSASLLMYCNPLSLPFLLFSCTVAGSSQSLQQLRFLALKNLAPLLEGSPQEQLQLYGEAIRYRCAPVGRQSDALCAVCLPSRTHSTPQCLPMRQQIRV